LSRLKVDPPSVDGDDIWTATVKKGSMLWQVRGIGTLVSSGHSANLIARVMVPDTFVADMRLNQNAEVDTRNVTTLGHVSYISPSSSNAMRSVDIMLDSPLPVGAGANLQVDAIIELGKLDNIQYVARPVHANQNSLIGVFRVVDDGGRAVRVDVKFGRASVNAIEVLSGLKEGDKIIPSDMIAWDNFDQIRLR
jgi:HlyD family secretion protein